MHVLSTLGSIKFLDSRIISDNEHNNNDTNVSIIKIVIATALRTIAVDDSSS